MSVERHLASVSFIAHKLLRSFSELKALELITKEMISSNHQSNFLVSSPVLYFLDYIIEANMG